MNHQDYHRLIATTLPAELTMDDRQLNKSARFFGGETEAGQSVRGLLGRGGGGGGGGHRAWVLVVILVVLVVER